MIQIIETNLMLNGELDNFQSRVIEVESWDYVIGQFIEGEVEDPMVHYDIHGRYSGVIVPEMCKITNLKYDEYRLSCEIEPYIGRKAKKLIELYKNID